MKRDYRRTASGGHDFGRRRPEPAADYRDLVTNPRGLKGSTSYGQASGGRLLTGEELARRKAELEKRDHK